MRVGVLTWESRWSFFDGPCRSKCRPCQISFNGACCSTQLQWILPSCLLLRNLEFNEVTAHRITQSHCCRHAILKTTYADSIFWGKSIFDLQPFIEENQFPWPTYVGMASQEEKLPQIIPLGGRDNFVIFRFFALNATTLIRKSFSSASDENSAKYVLKASIWTQRGWNWYVIERFGTDISQYHENSSFAHRCWHCVIRTRMWLFIKII